jgi:hypothetical protein
VEPERWRQIEQLYQASLEKAADLRPDFLEHACAGDVRLRREVEWLLAQAEENDHLPEEPQTPTQTQTRGGTEAQRQAVPIDSLIGQTISRYRILKAEWASSMRPTISAFVATSH